MSARLAVTVPRDYWLTANRTVVNHGYRRRIIDALHTITDTSARAQRLPAIDTPCVITWTIHYPKGTAAADPVNAHPTTKAICDALVPRWLTADDSRHVVEERFRRGHNLPEKGGHLVVATFTNADSDYRNGGESGRLKSSGTAPDLAPEPSLATTSFQVRGHE